MRIGALAKARRITGLEPGLTVAYNFDRGGRRGKARSVTFTKGRSGPIKVAKKRLNKLNFAPLEKLRPPQKVAWTLPFDKGQEWYVLWGNNTPNSSHNGGASFSWDFVLAAPGLPAGPDSNNSKTCGQRLRAVAPGKATLIDDDGISDKRELYKHATNILMGRIPHLEGVEYLHLQTHSVRQTFTATIPPPFISFARGQIVARVGARNLGPSNCHLHLASRATETGTIPREFSNYDLKNPQTGEWKRIARGVPATRDIVRNPPG